MSSSKLTTSTTQSVEIDRKLSCLDAVKRKRNPDANQPTTSVPDLKKHSSNRPAPSPNELGTVVGLVTDRSGSMLLLMGTQITGSMNIISDWQNEMDPSKTHCLVYTFDNQIQCSFQGTADTLTKSCLETIQRDMMPGGSTALYDAVIQSVQHQQKMVDAIWEGLSKSQRGHLQKLDFQIPVVLTVFTDGEDNCSTHSRQDMKRVVEEHRKKYGAKCIFAGANFDVREQGQLMGFAPQLSLQVSATPEYVTNAYQSIRQCSRQASVTPGGVDPEFTQLQRQLSADIHDQMGTLNVADVTDSLPLSQPLLPLSQPLLPLSQLPFMPPHINPQ